MHGRINETVEEQHSRTPLKICNRLLFGFARPNSVARLKWQNPFLDFHLVVGPDGGLLCRMDARLFCS